MFSYTKCSKLTREEIISGQVLLVDKPLEWTSFQAVNKIKYALLRGLQLKRFKVGHAGTLDPLATGLLIVCIGKKTKEIEKFMGLPKRYIAQVKLGATTPSYDLETEENATFPTDHISAELIETTLEQFRGEINQVPPIFSAIKKDGIRAYEHARSGTEIKMEPRRVTIHQLNVLSHQGNTLELEVVCSKGTYIRSLAHDLGKALSSGGYLTGLRRTHIGDFAASEGKSPEEWAAHFKALLAPPK